MLIFELIFVEMDLCMAIVAPQNPAMMATKALEMDVMLNEKLRLIGNDLEEALNLQVYERPVMLSIVPNVQMVALKNVMSEKKAIVC